MIIPHFIAMTANEFSDGGKAWIEAIFSVFDVAIAKIGLILLAGITTWNNVKTNSALKQQVDRQGKRIDQVALNSPPGSGLPTVPADTPSGKAVAVAAVSSAEPEAAPRVVFGEVPPPAK